MTDIDKASAFDPAAAVNAIRDRIRGAMLDIIPQAQWDQLIQAEMRDFMTDRQVARYHGGPTETQHAGFKVIVRRLLEEDATKRVRELLESPEWRQQCMPDGKTETSEAVQRYITENSGLILNKWLGEAVQRVVSQLSHYGR